MQTQVHGTHVCALLAVDVLNVDTSTNTTNILSMHENGT